MGAMMTTVIDKSINVSRSEDGFYIITVSGYEQTDGDGTDGHYVTKQYIAHTTGDLGDQVADLLD